MNILIVEDEWIVSEEIRETILSTGICEKIYQTDRADHALQIFNEKTIHLAILDIVIRGEMDGLSLGKEIHENFEKCHKIFLSSYYDDRSLKIFRMIKPLAIIDKPFNSVDLITALKKLKRYDQ